LKDSVKLSEFLPEKGVFSDNQILFQANC